MGVQGRNSVVANPMQRVKVYRLNDEGKWDDRGTGHVTVEYLEQSEAVGLIVIDEEDSETLLIHRISAEDIYRRQEDTIIAWRDPEIATELALSFQETMGCCFIWDQICGVQRSIHFPSVGGLEVGPRPSNDDLEHSGTSQGNDDSFHGASSELRELPPVELSTLPLILKTVMEGCSVDHYRVAELIVQDQRFLPKLLDLFKICEDLENIDGLHLIFKIMKGIIMLNSSQIFENIFNDEYIMGVVGALEYDPEFPCRQEHRAFLREHVLFKEAIPIRDPSLLSKIHQTYRVGYIKDVILPRVLDEPTFATLNSIIQSNNAAVVSSLKDDGSFIHELFARLKSSEASDQTKKNLVLFLQEFCSLSKSLQLVHQMRLFRDLVNEGLFEIITNALQSQEKLLRLNGTDILIVVLNQDPTLLRTFVMQPEGNALLGLLVKGMSTDFGEDLHSQYLEIIRMLLDPYTIAGPQRDSIIELFYDKYMDQLVDVITRSCPAKENTEMSRKSTSNDDGTGSLGPVGPDILSNICELLCFCVLQHPYRIKSYFLRNGVIEKVLCLTRRKEKYLVVAAVRFLRTIISRNDDRVHRDIVKYNLFDPVIRAFIANGNRYNLLNSAVLELVEYIRKENIKCLIVYLVEKFSDKMEKIDCADTFHALKLRYEQFLEGCPMGNVSSGGKGDGGIPSNHSRQISSISDPRKRMDERGLEKEEEDYFNEDSDDEEDSASARINHTSNQSAHPVMVNGNASTYSSFRGGSIGLVDYEDEDDSPEPGSSTKVSEVVKSNSMVSSFEMNDPLGHDVVDFANAKRKLDAIECNDGESESLKKHRLHTHTKAFSASADSIDRIEQFVSKEKHASSTFNHERDVESHRVEVDTGFLRGVNPGEFKFGFLEIQCESEPDDFRMGSRMKKEEKNEKLIRALSKLTENKKCINCNSLVPQCICTNFWTFVCLTCSGIHREFTHRVKSISMSKFTAAEVAALHSGGNERAREMYLKNWDFQRNNLPDSSNVERLRTFIKHVYVDRRYAAEGLPPRNRVVRLMEDYGRFSVDRRYPEEILDTGRLSLSSYRVNGAGDTVRHLSNYRGNNEDIEHTGWLSNYQGSNGADSARRSSVCIENNDFENIRRPSNYCENEGWDGMKRPSNYSVNGDVDDIRRLSNYRGNPDGDSTGRLSNYRANSDGDSIGRLSIYRGTSDGDSTGRLSNYRGNEDGDVPRRLSNYSGYDEGDIVRHLSNYHRSNEGDATRPLPNKGILEDSNMQRPEPLLAHYRGNHHGQNSPQHSGRETLSHELQKMESSSLPDGQCKNIHMPKFSSFSNGTPVGQNLAVYKKVNSDSLIDFGADGCILAKGAQSDLFGIQGTSSVNEGWATFDVHPSPPGQVGSFGENPIFLAGTSEKQTSEAEMLAPPTFDILHSTSQSDNGVLNAKPSHFVPFSKEAAQWNPFPSAASVLEASQHQTGSTWVPYGISMTTTAGLNLSDSDQKQYTKESCSSLIQHCKSKNPFDLPEDYVPSSTSSVNSQFPSMEPLQTTLPILGPFPSTTLSGSNSTSGILSSEWAPIGKITHQIPNEFPAADYFGHMPMTLCPLRTTSLGDASGSFNSFSGSVTSTNSFLVQSTSQPFRSNNPFD